jgi:selenocysteine-specific elongation factor
VKVLYQESRFSAIPRYNGRMLKAIVGTAGHVDHGKTTLLKALTGIDCDRLPEEKEREITIDLGFAFLKTSEVQLGFIDVPGHERFLKNLLAGIGGIDYFLFCIGADEGIKAQTIEHAQILRLLDLKSGIVALTKKDMVDGEGLEMRLLEVAEFLEMQGLRNIQVLPVSAATGENITRLKGMLLDLPKQFPPTHDQEPPFVLPLDRSFTVQGAGVIGTGTLIRGTLKAGCEALLLPEGIGVKVRTLEVHDERRDAAQAGERTSVSLAGVEASQVSRGKILCSRPIPAGRILTVNIEAVAEIEENQRVRLAHWTRETLGRLHWIDGTRAQVFLEEEIVALRGDRFILRNFSPQDLLGGGVILDASARRIKGGSSAAPELSLGSSVAFWLGQAGAFGLTMDELDLKGGFPLPHEMKAALDALHAVGLDDRRWHPEAFAKLKAEAEAGIKDYVRLNPWAAASPLKAAFKNIEDRFSEDVLARIGQTMGWTVQSGGILLKQPDALPPELQKIIGYYSSFGLQPPKPEEAAAALGIPLPMLRKQVEELIKRKAMVRVSTDFHVDRKALDAAVEKLRKTGWEKFSIAEFKDLLGLTRKHAVPLLEYLDGQRITIRAGDLRILKKG